MSSYEQSIITARVAPVDDAPRQAALRSARLQLLGGAAVFVVGVVLTMTVKYFIFYGAIVFGPIRAGRGAVQLLRLAALPPGSPVAAPRRRRWFR